jgi:hypothetical protein
MGHRKECDLAGAAEPGEAPFQRGKVHQALESQVQNSADLAGTNQRDVER